MEIVAIIGCFIMVALPILFVLALVMAITRKSKAWTAGATALGVLGIIAVVVLLVYAGKQAASKMAEMSQPRAFVTTDGLVEITAPGTWTAHDFDNEAATLQIGNLIGVQYLLVISESKREFPPEFGIEEYAEVVSGQMREVVEGSVESELLPMEINGLTAFRQELEGDVEGTSIAYLNTFIDGKEHFHQVLTWTLRDQKERHFPVFRETADSFREISDGGE